MSRQGFETVPIWTPTPKADTRINRFQKIVEDKYKLKFEDYHALQRWSTEHLDVFWAEFWDFCGVIYSKKYDEVINRSIPMEDSPKWFEGARLNFAENLLKYRNEDIAIIATGEAAALENITYKQLHREASLYAAAFRKVGLEKEDRVACYMSNRKEAVLAMIAVTSIGAIWTGGLPLLGPQAYLNRLKQVGPKFLITIDKFLYNKETKYLLKNIQEISNGLPSLQKVIIVPSCSSLSQKDIVEIPKSCLLQDFLLQGYDGDGSVPEMTFEQVSFSHPVFISYTSGTTGRPKTLVHGFGALLMGACDFWLHWNSSKGENWLSMSPVGWVSWNMVTNILFVGETITLFEGVPYFLSPTSLWDLVDDVKLTRLFLTPALMDQLEIRGYLPTTKHHLSSLNMVLCSGSVVKPRNFDFAFNKIKKGIKFVVAYGSTEIMGLPLLTEITLPIYSGEISSPTLGIAIEILDDAGKPVVGEMGEFVVTTPVPSMPLGIWGDADGRILKETYFSKYKGKFCLGDTVIVNPFTKGIIICGRRQVLLR